MRCAVRSRCARRFVQRPYVAGDEALRDTEIIKVCSLRGMDLRVSVEPQQGASYDDVVRVAKAADELGFDGFFRSDHYLAFDGDGLPGPTDAWVTLGALVRETSWVSSNGQASCLPGPERRTDQNEPRHGHRSTTTAIARRTRPRSAGDRCMRSRSCGCARPNSRTGTRPYDGCVGGPAAETA